MKSRQEEEFLTTQCGEASEAYRQEVPALVPRPWQGSCLTSNRGCFFGEAQIAAQTREAHAEWQTVRVCSRKD